MGDITDRRRQLRQVSALLLTRAGWTQQKAADHLGVTQRTVSNDVGSDIPSNVDDLLAESLPNLAKPKVTLVPEGTPATTFHDRDPPRHSMAI